MLMIEKTIEKCGAIGLGGYQNLVKKRKDAEEYCVVVTSIVHFHFT